MRAQKSLLDSLRALDADAARELARQLVGIWIATIGSPPGGLEDDLSACRAWFDPVAQGQRLRRELAALPELATNLQGVGDPFILEVGNARALVTPEGRCALEVLNCADLEAFAVSDAELAQYDRLLAEMYRDWSRHRILSVVQLLQGTTKPLQIPAAGVVLALLVNRCTSERRALRRYAATAGREVVDRAFFRAVDAFADGLAPARKQGRNQHLISGWMLYEAKRRLGDSLIVQDARGRDGRVWIREGAEADVLGMVARDLVRGHRARATPEQFERAFDALVDALREELPGLAGFGMAHEQPANTERIRRDAVTAVARYASTDESSGASSL